MIGSFVNIEVDGEELQKIFEDLERAENTIKDCYSRLMKIGVVKISFPHKSEDNTEEMNCKEIDNSAWEKAIRRLQGTASSAEN